MTWSDSVTRSAALAFLVLMGCGSPPPPALPAPEPEPEPELAPEPPPRPQISIEERIRAPFAVLSDGRTAVREPRNYVVVLAEGELPAARAPEAGDASPDPEPATTETTAQNGTDVEATETAEPGANRPATETDPPPSPPRATAAARSGTPREHTVEVGETWYGIARLYSVTPAALSAVNPGVDSGRLRVGQVVRLPAYARNPDEAPRQETPRAETPRSAAQPSPPSTQRTVQQRTHRVQSGETLWSIARRYGVTPGQIRTANRMSDDTVRIGQTLVIPSR